MKSFFGQQRGVNKWLLGLALVLTTSSAMSSDWVPDIISDFSGVVAPAVTTEVLPYRDVDTQVNPSLIIMGRSGKLFIEGNRAGYLLNRTDFGALSLLGQSRNHQYIPDDASLMKRDKAFELGFQLAKPITDSWSAQLTLFTDASDTHNGQEIEFGFYRRDFWGDFRLLTLFALQQQSRSLTGYYADTQEYSADGDLNGEVEFIGVYEWTRDINLTFVYRHYVHGNGLADSPLTDSRQTRKFSLGVGWSF